MTTAQDDAAGRLADVMSATQPPSIEEYAEALAATFPPITDAPEEARQVIRDGYRRMTEQPKSA